MTRLPKPNIDLLGNRKRDRLKKLGFPDDFVVVKEDRDTFTKRTLDLNIKVMTERGMSTTGITYDRIASIWDAYDLPKYMVRCALDEALRAYPNPDKTISYSTEAYNVFKAYYTVEKTGPLTYHCYLNMIGIAVEKL